MTPLGIEPTTFRLVAQCLKQLCHRVPLPDYIRWLKCCLFFHTCISLVLLWNVYIWAMIVGKKTTLRKFFFLCVKGLRSANSSIQEYYNFKRKGSPVLETCQPTKFISLAEAVCRFQTNTPDRFHSRPKTGKKFFFCNWGYEWMLCMCQDVGVTYGTDRAGNIPDWPHR